MTDLIGPQLRHCAVCAAEDTAPNLLPYLHPKKGHVWAHQSCAQRAHFEAHGIPETDLSACGGMAGEP